MTHENETDASVCYNCQSTDTPIWRREPGDQPLCNTCDLYYVSFSMFKLFVGGNHGSKSPLQQKHHGVTGPQSLTTGVIRNRYVPTRRSKNALPDSGHGSYL